MLVFSVENKEDLVAIRARIVNESRSKRKDITALRKLMGQRTTWEDDHEHEEESYDESDDSSSE